MKLLIVSDLHLGLKRQAHFTAESSAAREQASRAMLSAIINESRADRVICAGDFFDTFSNSESVILDALVFARTFDMILAGNHDVSNRESAKSSLEVVQEVAGNVLFDQGTPHVVTIGQTALHFVPHVLTQDLFDHRLSQLEPVEGKINLVFLHCNYDIPFDQDFSSLNLSRAQAARLLERFHRVFLGHVHRPSEDFDGRLVVIGSHFPTAFDNLEDKRHLIYDTESGEMQSRIHWVAKNHAFRGHPDQAPDGMQFYDFSAEADPKLVMRLFKAGALGIRTFCPVTQPRAVQVQTIERLSEVIARELLATDLPLYKLWAHLSEDAD